MFGVPDRDFGRPSSSRLLAWVWGGVWLGWGGEARRVRERQGFRPSNVHKEGRAKFG
jgi:hypothetical protein